MSDTFDISKYKRRLGASSRPLFEKKRFAPSSLNRFQELRRSLQNIDDELRKAYPEVITIALYGSHLKGYETPFSDIDIRLLLNGELVDKTNGRKPSAVYKCEELLRAHSLNFDQLFYEILSREDIVNILDEEEELTRMGFESCAGSMLFGYFLPCVNRDAVTPYRKLIIETCETIPNGNVYWAEIMDTLWHTENMGFPAEKSEARRQLYPFTLAQARIKYLTG